MRILVVDDTEPIRFLLERFFAALGHEVVALSGGNGVDAALAGARFDVVFTDLAMPNCSGWDVLAAVRQAQPGLPVVMMSGFGTDRGQRPNLAPDAVLEKPFSLDQLQAVLDSVVRP